MSQTHGEITRGTTNPNRLRRLDKWFTNRAQKILNHHHAPLAIDLGYGATPTTTIQWYNTLHQQHPNITMRGLEIDPARVHAAQNHSRHNLHFEQGGFELAGHTPHLVRAMNVLRQYDETHVPTAWQHMQTALADDGLIVEGTCDELGRYCTWILLDKHRPLTLTLAVNLRHIESPAILAQRLPKALIHHNIQGTLIHRFITAVDEQWRDHAALGVFGAANRWRGTVDSLADSGWPIHETPARRRDGTITVDWASVAFVG